MFKSKWLCFLPRTRISKAMFQTLAWLQLSDSVFRLLKSSTLKFYSEIASVKNILSDGMAIQWLPQNCNARSIHKTDIFPWLLRSPVRDRFHPVETQVLLIAWRQNEEWISYLHERFKLTVHSVMHNLCEGLFLTKFCHK